MRVCLQKGGPVIGSPSHVMNDFSSATEARQAEWEQRLTKPAAFRRIELEMKQHFDRGADHLTGALLARVTQGPEMEHHVGQVRQAAAVRLRAPQRRSRQVRLLSGLVLFVTTLYCPPKSAGQKRREATEHPAGLFPESAALGIANGSSPGLQATVARIVALRSSPACWRCRAQPKGRGRA